MPDWTKYNRSQKSSWGGINRVAAAEFPETEHVLGNDLRGVELALET